MSFFPIPKDSYNRESPKKEKPRKREYAKSDKQMEADYLKIKKPKGVSIKNELERQKTRDMQASQKVTRVRSILNDKGIQTNNIKKNSYAENKIVTAIQEDHIFANEFECLLFVRCFIIDK